MYAITIFVIIAAYYLISYLKWRRDVYNYIEKIPGDFKFPIIGTTYKFFTIEKEDIRHYITDTIEKYGGIFRVWLGSTPQVSISKPEYLEIIMKSSDHITKAQMYKYSLPWLGEGLLTSTGSKWHKHRKLITPTFHFKILEQFMEVFVEKADVLLEILDSNSNGKPIDIFPEINHYALDVICETAMGVTVNAMKGEDNKYIKAVYNMSEMISWRIRRPFITDFLFKFTQMGKDFEEYLEILHSFTKKVIKERKELLKNKPKMQATQDDEILGKKKRTSFLDLLLDMDGNAGLTDTELREEVDTFMFEGHDTTSAAISWTLFLLGNNPNIQDQVYEEVSSILQSKSTPSSITDLNEMKCLERVIKESLRMFPIVPLIGRRLQEKVNIGGYEIPANTELGIHIYGMQRNPKYYPNPNKFDPDRFLPENSVTRHPYAFVPFSAGPRNCIGQKFAMYEEKTVLSSIINRYKIKSVERTENVKATVDLVLKPSNGILVYLDKRKK